MESDPVTGLRTLSTIICGVRFRLAAEKERAGLRDQFPGYYRRTEEELQRIWEDGLFVLDANVLLNLYRYSEDTRNDLLTDLCEDC